jgi:hypothetical protein
MTKKLVVEIELEGELLDGEPFIQNTEVCRLLRGAASIVETYGVDMAQVMHDSNGNRRGVMRVVS